MVEDVVGGFGVEVVGEGDLPGESAFRHLRVERFEVFYDPGDGPLVVDAGGGVRHGYDPIGSVPGCQLGAGGIFPDRPVSYTPNVATDLPSVLIGQWRASPKIRAVIDIITNDRDTALAALDYIRKMGNVNTAEGIWLDILAARVGIQRPATTDPAADERFGFDQAGTGFDQAPYRGVAANDAVYPLPDALFRRLVRSRIVLLLGDGTLATFTRAVREIDPSATVQDLRDMTVRVVTSNRALIEIADTADALPRTAGVRVRYADRGRFGFDQAGVGFDQGPYTGIAA